MSDTERPHGYEFPGTFEVTAVGNADADLEAVLGRAIGECGLAVLAGSKRQRPSRAGNFVAVSLSFLCPDRERLEAVYAEVRKHPAVRWTL